MNPTIEQLNQWSAEALGWTTRGGQIGKCWCDANRNFKVYAHDWHPATDLSQAWREFVTVLESKKMKTEHGSSLLAFDMHGSGCCFMMPSSYEGYYKEGWVYAQGDTPDQKAAHALTYVFVKTMKPVGYMDWRAAA